MLGSLFTGISGLSTNAQAMQVIGDNIANVNTTAFKSNRSIFGDIISQAIEGGAFRKLSMGRGVTLMTTNPLWTQGSLETTGRTTDLAVSGRGLFVVGARNDQGETIQTFYTRDGSFNFDKDGYMVNSQGYVLKGYKIGEENKPIPTLTDIYIPSGASPPKVTSRMLTHLNLNADSSGGTQAHAIMEGGLGTPNADVKFTAVATGTAGNGIVVQYVDGGAGSPLSVAVNGKIITVSYDKAANTVTAKDVENLINNDPVAGGLVIAKAEGDGSGKISTTNSVTLSGGGEPTYATLVMDCGTDETSDVLFTSKIPGA
ncbi:MAG: flagellar hook-basal body complex protein, partial [Desulfatiglandales bacterium]